MSELKPRQWEEGEEAAWIADKVCILGDYGKDAARVLRKQADEIKQLLAKLTAEQAKSEKLAGQVEMLHEELQLICAAVAEEVNEKGGGGYILARLSDSRNALSATQSDVEAHLADIKNQGAIEALEEVANKISIARGQPGNEWGEGYTAASQDYEKGLRSMAAERKKKG